MNYLDIIFLLLLLFALINGFRKGLIEEVAGLAALILGIWAAMHFSGVVADFISENLKYNSTYLPILSFVATFVLVLVLVSLAGTLASHLINAVHLGFINRLAGLFFGILKGALILSVFLVVFNKLDEDVHLIPEETKISSRMYEPIRNFAPSIFPFLDFWDEQPDDSQGKKIR